MTITELTKKEMLQDCLSKLDFSNEPLFVQNLRSNAKKQVDRLDFPNSKNEYWKYTRVGKIVNKNYSVKEIKENAEINISKYLIPDLEANLIVLVDGFFHEELSSIEEQKGVKVMSLKEAIQNEDQLLENKLGQIKKEESEIFFLLNTQSFTDGVYIHVDSGVIANNPFHILNITTDRNAIVQTRNFFCVEHHASIKLVESFSNREESNLLNSVSEFWVSAGGSIEYNKIQNRDNENYQIATEQVYQERDSSFTINTVTLLGTIVRNNLNIDIAGEGCETNLNGVFLGKDSNHIDNHTIVDHLKPNCNSNEVYKGILDDNSVGVFNGKVFVRPDAQKTNAFQQSNNIVLNDNAVIYSKPELEIYADDVKCSHGSTTGQLDDEAIFYLRARGISKKNAIGLMINAFLKDATENISIQPLKRYIDGKIDTRFEGRV